jgi:alcohol dehydrogenase, propanol-preferring
VNVEQAISARRLAETFKPASGSLRHGTLVFVAFPPDNQVTIPIFETVLNGITILTSSPPSRPSLCRSNAERSARRARRESGPGQDAVLT